MKTIQIIGENYSGVYHHIRRAARCAVFDGDKILCVCMTNSMVFMLPGGGLEENETYADCCKREVEEETGLVVDISECALKIIEYYGDEKFETCYFLGRVIGQTNARLTMNEARHCLKPYWIIKDEMFNIFSKYDGYAGYFEIIQGTYYREFVAMSLLVYH